MKIELKEEIEKSTIKVGNFTISLSGKLIKQVDKKNQYGHKRLEQHYQPF